MSAPRRPQDFTQEKVILEASTVAAISATTTVCLGVLSSPGGRDVLVDKFEVEAPSGYASDTTDYYDISLQTAPLTYTAVAATDVCTATAHGLSTGDAVQVTTSSAAPAGLTVAVTYFAIVLTANTFKLATSAVNAAAGTAIDITGTGTGTQSVAKVFAMWSLKTANNGSLTDAVFATATLSANSVAASGGQFNVVLTKFASGANVPAGTRLVAHLHLL